MGPNGSGKGAQAALLCKVYKLIHISVGDIFRWNIRSHTKLAARIQRIMNAGQLVSDDIVEEVVRARLDEHDWNYGFILDGFPRSVTQAMFFLESYDIDAVINIEVPDQAVIERMLSRRLCAKCGLDFDHIPSPEGYRTLQRLRWPARVTSGQQPQCHPGRHGIPCQDPADH